MPDGLPRKPNSQRATEHERVIEQLAARPVSRHYSDVLARALRAACEKSLPKGALSATSVIDRFRKYRGREDELVKDVLRRKCWEFQRYTMQMLGKHRRVVVRAGRKVSKTETGADAVLAYELTHETLTLTTAPGGRQVKEQLWERISTILGNARTFDPTIPGELASTRFTLGPEHYALGLSTNRADRFQGWHAGVIVPDDPDSNLTEEALRALHDNARSAGGKRMLVVIDEAPSVPREIHHAIEGSMSGANTFLLMLGNPTLSQFDDHPFVRAFAEGSGFHRIKVSSLPDIGDPTPYDKSFVAPNWLVDPEWIEHVRNIWGENSPMWQAYVIGRFVTDSKDFQFIPGILLEECADLELDDSGAVETLHLGVDVAASENRDSSVAALWRGKTLAAIHEWRTGDTMATASLILKLARRWGVGDVPIRDANIHIDNTGVGKGVVDRLRQLGHYVDAVDFGRSPRYSRRDLTGSMAFKNVKGELLWTFRRALEEQQLCVPRKYAEVWKQAGWYTFKITPQRTGSLIEVVEDKEKLRATYGKSPDHLEAAMIGLARGGVARSSIVFTDRLP